MPRFEGAIFDVDGVLVDSPHEEAWREALRELMEGPWQSLRPRTTWSRDRFTSEVYQKQISGKPRLAGARAALAYFGVPDTDRRADEYAATKQSMVVRLIDEGDFTAYADALRFVLAIKDQGVAMAAASSSKNAALLLDKIRVDVFAEEQGISSSIVRPGLTLLGCFDADVSGQDFAHGKPHPDMFLAAAQALRIRPSSAVVVEDAVAGVEAAKRAGMTALAVARADDRDLLEQADADLVVATLDDVDTTALARGQLAARGTG